MGDIPVTLAVELIKSVVSVYDVITYPVYAAVQRPWVKTRKQKAIRAAPENPNDPYSPWVRLGKPAINPVEGCTTIPEILSSAMKRHAEQRCMGIREVLMEENEVQPDGKIFIKKTLAPNYKWFTFSQVDNRIADITRGLLLNNVKPGDKVIIFMETRMEWMLCAQAIFRVGATLATLYATLGDEGITHVINEIEATHIITSSDLMPKLAALREKLPTMNTIIYVDTTVDKTKIDANRFRDFDSTNVALVDFDDLERDGSKASPDLKGIPPKPDDIALIMYTSGSTGAPKGVMAWHKNFIAAIGSLNTILAQIGIKAGDTYIGYLPLAHNLEFTTEHLLLAMGIPVGYSSPFTLTDKSPQVKAGQQGDAQILQPAALVGVPLILDRLRKGITEQVEGRGKLFQELFRFAIEYKNRWTARGFSTPIINALICKKIKANLGGKVHSMFCGGAPLSPDTQAFAKACLDINLMQGFGATETTAITSLMDPFDGTSGRTGAPLFGAKVKLIDWDEGNYHPTDKPNPRGEIVVGGDFITPGYFKMDQATAEVFKEENGIRWFYTGDIGEIYPDGTIKIIDRKKDLLKLQHGEYISLGKVESELKSSAFVDNICVYGDSFYNNLVAIIIPNPHALKNLAKSLGLDESVKFEALCDNATVRSEVTKSVMNHGKKAGLHKSEIPTMVKLCKEEWTPDSGLVTAALKIRRKPIKEFYQQDIDEMYGKTKSDTDSNGNVLNGHVINRN